MKKKCATQSAFLNVRVLIGLCVVVAGISLALFGLGTFSNALAQVQGKSDQKEGPAQQPPALVSHERIEPVSVSVIDFQKLAEADQKAAMSRPLNEPPLFIEFPPPEIPRPTPPLSTITGREDLAAVQPSPGMQLPLARPPELTRQTLIPSPQPSLSFLAQEDGPVVGTNTYVVPPDTTGDVGPDKLFVTLNRNYRVQNKNTGAVLSEVSGDTFWSSTGATYGGDPRVVFDPYNNRWLVSSLGGGRSILVGVSSTSDPQGIWTLFRFIVGCEPGAPGCNPNGESPDFDMLGFNKNWSVVSWDHSTGAGKLLILDYPALRAGTATATIVTVSTYPNRRMHAATTLSPTEGTLYIPVQEDGGNALYRLHRITGTPSTPVFTFDTVSKVRPGGGWTGPDGEHMPQTCIGTPGVTCPVTPLFLDAGSDRVLGPVFRSGNIWYSQIIGLPANGWTHTAVQWTRISTSGAFVDGGRVEDPTATSSNGGEWYSQPSIAVNTNNDVLLGFSNFSSAHLANAGYAFRFAADPLGTIRGPIIFKQGEDYYHRGNRWGDYSHTVVDPANGVDMWTIQEYARMRVTPSAQQDDSNSRWGTWWAKVSPAPNRFDFDGDRKTDYVLFDVSTHQTAIWYLNNNVYIGGGYGPTLPAGWMVVDVADFNGDGKPDYALSNPYTQQTAIWYLNNNIYIGGGYGPTLPSGWQLVAVGDFNGDGKPDYALFNPGTRQTAVWYLNNRVYVGGGYGPILPSGWQLVAVGDFNGDGKPDYVLYNSNTRQTAIWYLNNRVYVSGSFGPTIASGYVLSGVADFSADGKPDYALYNPTTRQTAIWYLNNNVYVSGAYGPTLPPGWSLVGP